MAAGSESRNVFISKERSYSVRLFNKTTGLIHTRIICKTIRIVLKIVIDSNETVFSY